MAQYAYGWRPSKPDINDLQFKVPSHLAAALPPTIDLESEYTAIYDQSRLGSCVANGTLGEVDHVLLQVGAAPIQGSRLFVYYNGRSLEGTINSDSGLSIRDGLKSVNKWGVPPETDWPYDISKFKTKPPQPAYDDALKNLVKDYAGVTQSPSAIQGAIASHRGVVIGFTVYESLETPNVDKSGVVPMPRLGESVLGGHCVVLCGYDQATQYYKFRNSWGTGWGRGGYGFLPFAYVHNQSLAGDFWVINTMSGPPAPPPGPTRAVKTFVLLDSVGAEITRYSVN